MLCVAVIIWQYLEGFTIWTLGLYITHVRLCSVASDNLAGTQHLVRVNLAVAAGHGELTDKDDADAAADDIRIDIGPPLVQRAAHNGHTHVDGEGQSTDAAGDNDNPIEEARHLLVPPLNGLVASLDDLLAHRLLPVDFKSWVRYKDKVAKSLQV